MILKTKRLILRPLKESDANSIVQNIDNLEVSKWLLVVPYPYARKDALFWIRSKKRKKKSQIDCTFGIELKSEKAIIGAMGLHKVDRYQGCAEVGYWLGKRHHRQGYGSEALKVLIDFSFNKLKLRRLEAGVFTGNPSSGKLLEKFGFKREGLKVKARRSKADGQIKDEIFYGLLKENYAKSNH
ncbi:MAG: GNAT family N-acetyltransferase [Nanoarchaeota archaeon]